MSAVVPPVDDLTPRERLSPLVYQAATFARLALMGLRAGPLTSLRAARELPWLRTFLSVNKLIGTMTRGRRGIYRDANAYLIANVVDGISEMIEGIFAKPELTVLHEDLVPPELLYGMGLHPWMAELLGIVVPLVEPTGVEEYIDVAESEGIPPDVCSLPKSTMGMALSGHLPRPRAIIASNMPCDGGMTQYTVLERELNAPIFRLDVPYDFYGERAVRYFAGELSRLIGWLERVTPGRMDWGRMREVCEERNRNVEAELELWDLVRLKPAPLAAETVYLSHLMWGIAQPGHPRGTKVFRKMVDFARRNVEAGISALEDERYRAALWNPPTLISVELPAWAERVYGVALIMDMLTFHRHPYIDTSTPETMLRGLSEVIMQGPMARHTRGPAANFFGDLFHLYEHFDLDMIWMAGHIGCKNTQALNGMFREQCRQRDIPLLIIDYDLSDTRIVSPESIRDQVARFMETVMRADRLLT